MCIFILIKNYLIYVAKGGIGFAGNFFSAEGAAVRRNAREKTVRITEKEGVWG
jgi:hypothetical protein